MDARLTALYERYRDRAILKGSSALLKPDDARMFAGEIGAVGVVNLIPQLWYYIDGDEARGLIEDPAVPDFTDLARQRNATRTEPGWVGNLAEETAAAAQDYLRHDLPERVAYVSFVLDVPLQETFERYIAEHPMV